MVQEPAGRVLNLTLRGDLLLQAPAAFPAPRALGRFLVDARKDPVAKVVDIIGPVDAPLVVAAPKPGLPAHRLVGRDLWLADPRRSDGRRPSRTHARSNPRDGRGGGRR